ncbi:unnamed protein product [Dovyalis caffra]|uniref:Protein SIEVE ELEMENT OCCLUSION B-like n=1 Tax=Dovyalis caffra TaxID=77055 RepID=A0AAV1R2F5_9ROSI|nr:unnamed protein product [Dovyalis caffra]
MATNQTKLIRGDRLMFSSFDDNALVKQIQETHNPDGLEYDVKPLLHVVENIFNSSNGSLPAIAAPVTAAKSHTEETLEDETYQNKLAGLPLELSYAIERIAREIAWKCSVGGDSHAISLSILDEFSNYSWDDKLAIALAAFALNYGEFWLIAQSYSSNQLAKSVSILKQFPDVFGRSSMLKLRLDAVRNLIKAMLDIAKCIVEFKGLSSQYNTADVTAFSTAMDHIPIAVYWTIRSIVACTFQITSLFEMGHEHIATTEASWELSSLAHKLSNLQGLLMAQLTVCYKHVDEMKFMESYQKLLRLFEIAHPDNMRVLKALLCSNDDQQPIVEGATKRRVNIDILRRKYVLLLISDLDILQEELAILEHIYNEHRKNRTWEESQYEVVWLPILRPGTLWTESTEKQFKNLQALMPWHTVYNPSVIDGAVIKFIKEVCHFETKHILVALDPQGKIACPNALPMMCIWGIKAFPFTTTREEALWKEESWRVELLVDGIDQTVLDWLSEGRFICVYGGVDIDWVRKFTSTARAVALAADIPLGMVYVGKSNPKERVRRNISTIIAEKLSHYWQDVTSIWYFWVRIESMWLSKNQQERTIENDPIMQEIMTLLSFDAGEGGWAIMNGGGSSSKLMARAKGTTFLTCLSEYSIWKEQAQQKGFLQALKDHLKELHLPHNCNRLKLPTIALKMPERVVCPECGRTMKKFTLYQCCDE